MQSVHLLYALVAITGNLDIPGGTNIGWNITLDFGGQTYDGNGEESSANQKKETVPPNPVTQEQRDSTIGLDLYPIYKLLLGKAVPDEFLPRWRPTSRIRCASAGSCTPTRWRPPTRPRRSAGTRR